MKTLLSVASLLLLVSTGIGCGDDTTAATADLAMGKDMTAVATDMAKLNCSQLLACVMACTTQTCAGQCAANASTTASTKAGLLAACIVGTCGTVDGGSGACTSTSDTSQACQQCEQGAVIGACNSQYTTCTADM